MINPGDTLVNSVTGEELTFLQTVRVDGRRLRRSRRRRPARWRRRRGARASQQSETFTAIEGTLALRVGGSASASTQGECATVEAGTAHRFWNDGDEPVMFHCVSAPRCSSSR